MANHAQKAIAREIAAETKRDGRMTTRPRSTGDIVRLKVTLRGIRPPIWRRLLVPSATPLAHCTPPSRPRWAGTGLIFYAWDIGGEQYGDLAMVDDVLDELRLTLGGVRRKGVKRFTYTYDFGDDWEHSIDIEGTERQVRSELSNLYRRQAKLPARGLRRCSWLFGGAGDRRQPVAPRPCGISRDIGGWLRSGGVLH